MSASALCKGLEDYLRDALGDEDGRFVFHSPDLRPPASACSFRTHPFIVTLGKASSQPGPAQGGDHNDRVYTAQVVVTAWLAYAPHDRQAGEMAAPSEDNPAIGQADVDGGENGMLETAERIGALIEEEWEPVAAMNAHLPGYNSTTNGFIEPFKTHTIGQPEPCPASWIHAEKMKDFEVYKIVITVSGARRIRVRGTVS